MKAAVYLAPENMVVKEVEEPKCGPGEVKLKVGACAICGTDVRIYFFGQKNVKPPAIVGHEIAGTIVEIGKGVEGLKVGQKACVITPVGCGRCRYCRAGKHNLCVDFRAIGYDFPGGFAQYITLNSIAVTQGNVLPIPDGVPFDEAALVEPLSCAINGQTYLNIGIGDSVVIIGAGPIGCMHLELAKSQGATKTIMVDVAPAKLDLVRSRFEADLFIDSSREDPVKRVMDETGGGGADVVIVACSAHVAQQQAVAMAAKLGRVSFFAGLPKDKPTIEFDSNALHYREISLFGAYASHATEYMSALALVASRKVDARKLISHRVPLEGLAEAIRTVRAGNSLKIVVEP